jgi:hypothetical protein
MVVVVVGGGVVIAIPRATANVDATNGPQTARNTASRALTADHHVKTKLRTRRDRAGGARCSNARDHGLANSKDAAKSPTASFSQLRTFSTTKPAHSLVAQICTTGAGGPARSENNRPQIHVKRLNNYVIITISHTRNFHFRRASHRYCSCQSVTTAYLFSNDWCLVSCAAAILMPPSCSQGGRTLPLRYPEAPVIL